MSLKAWYQASTKFQQPANFEAQQKISEILNNHFEDSKRTKVTKRQKQSYHYDTELWRDIKISPMNKRTKVKTKL